MSSRQVDTPRPEEETPSNQVGKSLCDAVMSQNLSKLAKSNHTLSRFITEDVWGKLATNSLIGDREWCLVAIMASMSVGSDAADQLATYIAMALRHGVTEVEIQDLVAQAGVFYSLPKTIAAQQRVDEILLALDHLPRLPRNYLERQLWLGDHHTMICDSNPTDNTSVPIILVHALGLDRRMWHQVFLQISYSSPSVRLISYDLRGHGHARSAPQVTSLDHLADDLATLLSALNITTADIYGQSYGGAVVQYFGLRYASIPRSLGLVTTAAEGQASWVERATRAETAGSVSPLLPETIIRWFTPQAIARNEWGVRYARACVERISVQNWASAWRAMSGLDTLSRLREIQVPIHIICGKQDASTGPKWMTKLRDACGLGRATYAELDPGVHMMALEQGIALAEEILRFREGLGD
ncbi:uncharacterized protein A1O9_08859 [Exophiala aquamarina CBS 119918]|uniref:AB hydrolase-1 domain-containing protein n=1 Tax=Exophiala aquamarina CBS 119918 TaxID=1182545 RepID=A0A072PI57_9EURO|nr:uncharacterized protein A1O9_08859 [Exophiala aquamarina CBS 119918]KEF55205.1 hypothetical protein A1O9_08859 [Exophiala aquamarina CBS 119918]